MYAVLLTLAAIVVASAIATTVCVLANVDPLNNRFVAAICLPAIMVFLGVCVLMAHLRMVVSPKSTAFYRDQVTSAGELLGEMWEAIVGAKPKAK